VRGKPGRPFPPGSFQKEPGIAGGESPKRTVKRCLRKNDFNERPWVGYSARSHPNSAHPFSSLGVAASPLDEIPSKSSSPALPRTMEKSGQKAHPEGTTKAHLKDVATRGRKSIKIGGWGGIGKGLFPWKRPE